MAWVFMLDTPIAVVPGLFCFSQGTIITFAALGGVLLAVVGPLILRDPQQPKKAARATRPSIKAPDPRASASVDDDIQLTRRQQQHQWCGDHKDLDWRDREQAEAWGMDADTHKSNWLEAD